MTGSDLYWLEPTGDWRGRLRAAEAEPDPELRWRALQRLANLRLDFVQTNALDRALQRGLGERPPSDLVSPPIRLAILGSSSVEHLAPAIRVAGARRGLWIETYVCGYGQYHQDLILPGSDLAAFKPEAVLFALDARHLLGLARGDTSAAAAETAAKALSALWAKARELGASTIIQQAPLGIFPATLGEQEHRLETSRAARLQAINTALRGAGDRDGVELLALDRWAANTGLDVWYDAALWHRAKQEVRLSAAPLYGDLAARVLAAARGRSAKALVLDLDNTLWGGVIGDDGLEGIILGQGDAEGEAFLEFQQYAAALSQRGVILAVCSKNDPENAVLPFENHPEMCLKLSDIGAFVANWNDKADNLKLVAERLNIGLDALVFVDDNPFERAIVRRELPMVQVPELPEDPAHFARCVADAGYFESLRVTAEDLGRARAYHANIAREAQRASATDMAGYLRSLDLKLHWKPFDRPGAARILQLINKTNQFNLTTRRYTEPEVAALVGAADGVALQLRLTDCFGDNGMISVIIARPDPKEPSALVIDTWLMSCRVLSRQVEEEALNLLVEEARKRSARSLTGVFRATAKNGMVRDHYARLGFTQVGSGADGETRWTLDLADYTPRSTFISVEAG